MTAKQAVPAASPLSESGDRHPSVVKVTVKRDYQILLEFDNNETGILDMRPYLNFGVFSKLREPAMFDTARVVFDTVGWANGIDLDPEFAYEKAE